MQDVGSSIAPVLALALSLAVSGCGGEGDPVQPSAHDSAAADAERNGDAGSDSTGPTDAAGEADEGRPPPDEGAPDEGPPDEGAPDEGAPDEGAPDEGPPDEGAPDEGLPQPDAGKTDEGKTDGGEPPKDDGSGSGGCVLHSECTAADPCSKALCIAGKCVEEAVGCDDGEPCTKDDCDPADGCTHTWGGALCEAPEVLFEASFDDGTLSGLSVLDLAKSPGAGAEPVVWTPDKSQTFTGAGALYFGIPGKYDFDTGKVVASVARTPSIALPPGADIGLRLAVWLDVEPGSDWDTLGISVEVQGGGATPVFAKTEDNVVMKKWQVLAVDLRAFAGKTVAVAFTFDSVDPTFNHTVGVFLDAIAVTARSPVPCADDTGCDDGIGCTSGTCATGGACSFALAAGCCLAASDCADGNVCTLDLCGPTATCEHIAAADPECCNNAAECDDGNACTADTCTPAASCSHAFVAGAGCCQKSSECNDSDPCTIDACVDFLCSHTNTCCKSNDECDDGDDICTVDACVAGKCVFSPVALPECCDPTPFTEAFDSGATLEGWKMAADNPPCKWGVSTTGKKKSAPGALYYGNPSTMDVSCGMNSGTATSPLVALPDKAGVYLEVDVYGAFDSFFDSFEVRIVPKGGTAKKLFDGTTLGATNSWVHKKVSLSAYKGQEVQIQIYFSSMGLLFPFMPASEGVYIDNLQITVSCG